MAQPGWQLQLYVQQQREAESQQQEFAMLHTLACGFGAGGVCVSSSGREGANERCVRTLALQERQLSWLRRELSGLDSGEVVRSMDRDHDGNISSEEFSAGLQGVGIHLSAEALELVFMTAVAQPGQDLVPLAAVARPVFWTS